MVIGVGFDANWSSRDSALIVLLVYYVSVELDFCMGVVGMF